MTRSDRAIVAVATAALTVALVSLARSEQALHVARRAPTATTIAVHRDALASHDQRLRAMWRTQDQLSLRLARVERDGGVR